MKKSKLLLSLTSFTTLGLVSTTLASCGCGSKQEDVTVKSITVSLKDKEYFKEGEKLSKDYIKVVAKTSDGKESTIDYNADGTNGYKLVNVDMDHTFTAEDVKENYEVKVSYKDVENSVKFTVSANVTEYNEHVVYFKLDPVVKGKDIVATFSPEEGCVLDKERTGLYVDEDVYTAKDNPDVISFDYANDDNKYTMTVSGSVVTSTYISLGIRCKTPDVPVESVKLDKNIIKFASGSASSDTLNASVLPTTATQKKVNWSITKGSDLIAIKSSGDNNEKCAVVSYGTTGEAEVTCASESTPSLSAKCKIIIEDSSIKLTGEHNFDIGKHTYISIAASTTQVSQLYWSVSDPTLATLQDGSISGVKVYPTENAKKYGGFVYVYAKDEQQNIQAYFPISFGSFSLLDSALLKNGIAKWCETAQISDVDLVIPSWYIYTDGGTLSGKEISIYTESKVNVDKIKYIFIPYSINSIANGAFNSWTNLTDIIIDYENAIYTSGGDKDETLNKRFNGVVLKNTKTLIAGCKNTWLDNVENSPIQTIGKNAFSGTGLTTLDIPTNIHEIEAFAFSDCTTLNKLTFSGIANSKWTISNDDHTTCKALFLNTDSSVAATQLKDNASFKWNNINYVEFKEVTDSETGIKSYEVYCQEANTSKITGKLIIPSKYDDKDVTGIYYTEPVKETEEGTGGFEECINLESVYIPSTITYISKYAFRNCTELSKCEIEKLEYVDRGAFHYTGNLKKMDINNNAIIALGYGAFAEGGLHEFTIPSTCCEIAEGCFLNCMLREVEIIKPTTESGDWKTILNGNIVSINQYCISKGKESIYTNKKVAAKMLRFGFSETAELWGFANHEWKTNLY